MNSRQLTTLANKIPGLKLIILNYKTGYELIREYDEKTDNINHTLNKIQAINANKKYEDIEDFVICYVNGKIKGKDFSNSCLYTLNETYEIEIPTIGEKQC